MTIGLLNEPDHEHRVSLLPEAVAALKSLNVQAILVAKGAGERAFASDAAYEAAGATITSREEVVRQADLLMSINPLGDAELSQAKPKQVQLAVFQPLGDKELCDRLVKGDATTFSMDLVPRTTRAQTMDILSSQATAAGYLAVLTAATHLPKFFPMFTTAAGSIPPSKLLILGAGVAGLQAIATARRLGAIVEVFDVRSAVKEEVQSLGAKFVEVEGATEDKAAGGYAVEQTEEFKAKQQQMIQDHAIKSDVVICTAQIPGRRAPLLITKATVESMKPGSVIIDLAASTGGNCELTQNDRNIVHNGVTIIGNSNLPSNLPSDSSKMYGKNMLNFLKLIIDKGGNLNLNFEDDIVAGTCLTHNGALVHERAKQSIA